jgi:hypothetical protein
MQSSLHSAQFPSKPPNTPPPPAHLQHQLQPRRLHVEAVQPLKHQVPHVPKHQLRAGRQGGRQGGREGGSKAGCHSAPPNPTMPIPSAHRIFIDQSSNACYRVGMQNQAHMRLGRTKTQNTVGVSHANAGPCPTGRRRLRKRNEPAEQAQAPPAAGLGVAVPHRGQGLLCRWRRHYGPARAAPCHVIHTGCSASAQHAQHDMAAAQQQPSMHPRQLARQRGGPAARGLPRHYCTPNTRATTATTTKHTARTSTTL